jgi:hypothetical protein
MYSNLSVFFFVIYSTASKLKFLLFHKSDKYSIPSPADFSVIQFFEFNSLIHVKDTFVYIVKYRTNLIIP